MGEVVTSPYAATMVPPQIISTVTTSFDESGIFPIIASPAIVVAGVTLFIIWIKATLR